MMNFAELTNGIPKGLCSFGGVTPHKMGRCPKDRGDALQERASLNGTARISETYNISGQMNCPLFILSALAFYC